MTREECKKFIYEKAKEIKAIYKEFHPDGDALSISMTIQDEYISFHNNEHENEEKKISFFTFGEEEDDD